MMVGRSEGTDVFAAGPVCWKECLGEGAERPMEELLVEGMLEGHFLGCIRYRVPAVDAAHVCDWVHKPVRQRGLVWQFQVQGAGTHRLGELSDPGIRISG